MVVKEGGARIQNRALTQRYVSDIFPRSASTEKEQWRRKIESPACLRDWVKEGKEKDELVRVLLTEAVEQGFEDDLEVEQERPLAKIVEIVFDALLHLFNRVCFPPESIDLG